MSIKKIPAEIITIGDELLFGQITDTNAQWMSNALSDAGIHVVRKTTVGDVESEILSAFAEAERRVDVVLITGGLGPTRDDLTKPCLAKHFNCDLVMHEEALAEVTAFFKSRGRELTDVNRQQAALPSCCEKITNKNGTAPGMWFHRNRKIFVSMPGVPHEMKQMMTDSIVPRLKSVFGTPVIHHTFIRTIGLGESFLAEKIRDWELALPEHIRLAYLPGLGQVKLRLTAVGDSFPELQRESSELVARLDSLVGRYIYSRDDDPLEVVVGKLLKEKRLTLSAAESCTGGYVAHLITTVPGSSAYFTGSMTCYANEIKIKELGVPESLLQEHGAVSEPVVLEMAKRIRERFVTDIGVATSGVAGPDGGTPDKPVGTVWMACSDKRETVARKLQLSRDRLVNINVASYQVLNLIRLRLLEAAD